MPVKGRGAFPKPSAVHREEDNSGSGVIVEYRALKKLQDSSEALKILRRIGASVRPIMMKHGWRLPLLVEMYPKQDNLLGLNVNRGKKIALRLRRPYNDREFIDEESITETMLHELAHNLRGPHDEIFFQHLEMLTQEFYDLRANRPLPGLGFMSAGQKLGGRGGLNNTANSAQRRRDISQIMGSGSNKVGGSTNSNLSHREAAAAAAYRRKIISMGCPSNNLESTQEANEEQEQQELLHGVEVITIGDDEDRDDDDFEIIEKGQKEEEKDSSDDEIVVTAVKRSKREDSVTATRSGNWNCQTCTLLNDRYAEFCIACETVRPGIPFWVCRSCQHRMIGTYAAFWCCAQCQTVKVA